MSSQFTPPDNEGDDLSAAGRAANSPRLVAVAGAAVGEPPRQLVDRKFEAPERAAVSAVSAVAADAANAAEAVRGSVPDVATPEAAATPFRQRRVRIDTESLKARWFRDANGERNTVSRDFQDIKRPLLTKALGRGTPAVPNGRRIMVTSALPKEGKTFCAINLALSIAAERDHGVLLVDADVARPSVPQELGIKTGLGLIDWLANENCDIRDLVLATNIKRFSILPAGRRHSRATEFLSSESMRRLLDRLDALFPDEIIVFDSPPLMITSEAHALAAHMGQIVMVVAAGQTKREVVTQALSKLEGAPVAGVVLNKVSQSHPSYYGAY